MDCNYLNYYNNCKYGKGKGTPIPNGPKPDKEACTQKPTGDCPKEGMTREENIARSALCKNLCPEKPAWKGGYLLSPYAINENCEYKKNWEACNKKKTPIKNGPIPDAKNCGKGGDGPPNNKTEDPDKCPKEGVLRTENIERAKKCQNLCKERSKSGAMGVVTGFDSIKQNCDYKKAYEACNKKKTPIKNGPVPNADACKSTPPGPPTDDKGCPSTGVTRAENLQRAHDCTTLCMEKGKAGGPLKSFDSIKMDCNYLNYYNNCKYGKGKGTPIPNGPKPDKEACTQNPTGDCPKEGMTREQNIARSALCKDLCPEKPAWKGGYLLSPYAINENCEYKKNWEACNKKKTPIKNGPIPDAKNCGKGGDKPKDKKDEPKNDDPNKCPKGGVLRTENIERAKKC